MTCKPLTLFVFVATAGDRIFKAVAERHQSVSLQALSSRSRLQGSNLQLLGDMAVVCAVPVSSVFRARALGQSGSTPEALTTFEIFQEVCLGFALALLFACFLRRLMQHWKVASPAQPTKGACNVELSPQKGLTTFHLPSPWEILALPVRLWQFGLVLWQKRRLYMHAAEVFVEGILPRLCGPSSCPLANRLARPSGPGSHGLHDWHEALATDFLMPVEVAACRSSPEVSAALQRLLADRWWVLEVPQPMLESVPEDECLMCDVSDMPELSECS